jgi:hypothetical protein
VTIRGDRIGSFFLILRKDRIGSHIGLVPIYIIAEGHEPSNKARCSTKVEQLYLALINADKAIYLRVEKMRRPWTKLLKD